MFLHHPYIYGITILEYKKIIITQIMSSKREIMLIRNQRHVGLDFPHAYLVSYFSVNLLSRNNTCITSCVLLSTRKRHSYSEVANITAKMDVCDINMSENNVLAKLLADFVSLDLWILLRIRRFVKCLVKLLGPLVEIICIMFLGAGILFAYTLTHVKIDIPAYNDGYAYGAPKPVKEGLLSIVDSSTSETSLLQRELARLKSKALNLEMNLRRMKSQFKNFYQHKNTYKDEDLADFASEAAGGSVIGTPDTESYYQPKHKQATIFGIPIWKPNYFTPRKVIQPWTQAGECWAFRGQVGKVEIELAHTMLIEQVTLEHIPVSASLTGSLDSAPKEFKVKGNSGNSYTMIDTFLYNINGPSSQTFNIRSIEMRKYPFERILLEVRSNWGHPEYTCIYRFKVHGRMYKILENRRNPKDDHSHDEL